MKKRECQTEHIQIPAAEFQQSMNAVIQALQTIADKNDAIKNLEIEIAKHTEQFKYFSKQLTSLEDRINSLLNLLPADESIAPKTQAETTASDSVDKGDGYESVIRLSIVELRDKSNMSFREIADKFNDGGIKPFKGKGGKWYPQSIQRLYAQMKQSQMKKP